MTPLEPERMTASRQEFIKIMFITKLLYIFHHYLNYINLQYQRILIYVFERLLENWIWKLSKPFEIYFRFVHLRL